MTDGTPGGEEVPVGPPLADVGIRLKGGANGSFRTLSGKAAFKLKFNKFVKGQKFEGLEKMTLSNMLEDSSMIHETLTYAAFRAAGVPASRTGYADVRVNGDDFGIYLNIETLDDLALERWFGPKSIEHADRPGELAAFLGPEESSQPPHAMEAAPESAAPSLFVGRSRRETAALVAHLWLPGPGAVSRTATFETVHGRRNACSVHASVLGGGRDLRCPLSASALSHLRFRDLELRMRTSFVAVDGAEESASRNIHLTRSRSR